MGVENVALDLKSIIPCNTKRKVTAVIKEIAGLKMTTQKFE
jgi:hypothetical protein